MVRNAQTPLIQHVVDFLRTLLQKRKAQQMLRQRDMRRWMPIQGTDLFSSFPISTLLHCVITTNITDGRTDVMLVARCDIARCAKNPPKKLRNESNEWNLSITEQNEYLRVHSDVTQVTIGSLAMSVQRVHVRRADPTRRHLRRSAARRKGAPQGSVLFTHLISYHLVSSVLLAKPTLSRPRPTPIVLLNVG